MSATSSSTPIAIRTPFYKYKLLNRTTALSSAEAYSTSTVARLGTFSSSSRSFSEHDSPTTPLRPPPNRIP
jgi:hypothetical protein